MSLREIAGCARCRHRSPDVVAPAPASASGLRAAFYPGLGHDPVHGDVMGLREDGGNPGRRKPDADHQWPCGKSGQRVVKVPPP